MVLLLKNLLFTLIVPGTVAGLLPHLLARGEAAAGGAPRALALALYAVGASIYAWCLWDFASFGRGTPAPIDAPKKLVVRGLYRFTRNPMYVGVLTVLLAWATLFQSLELLAYAVGVGCCFQAFIVLYEEPHLGREFGPEYEAYRRRVGRWLLRPSPRR